MVGCERLFLIYVFFLGWIYVTNTCRIFRFNFKNSLANNTNIALKIILSLPYLSFFKEKKVIPNFGKDMILQSSIEIIAKIV